MQVVCEHCGKPVRVFSETASSMPCPHCGKEVTLTPTASVDPALTELEGYAAVAKSVKRGRIDFICSNCNKRLAAQLGAAGKTVTCPNCRSSLQVPAMEDGSPPPPPAEGGSVFDDELKLTSGPAVAAPVRGARVLRSEDLTPVDLSAPAKPAPAATSGNGRTNGKPATAKKSRFTTVIMFAAGLVLTAAISLIAIHFITMNDGPADTGGGEAGLVGDPVGDSGVDVTGRGDPGPDVRFVDDPPRPDGGESQPAATGRADVAVVTAYRDIFANAGYLAAQPGRGYVKVTVKIKPIDRSVAFNTYGKDVTLTVGEKTYEALGALSGCSVFPLTGERVPAGISSGQTRSVMFLFDLPVDAVADESLTLRIERVGEVSFRMPPPAAAPEAAAMAGEYVEAFPRSLKPLAKSPILAAIEGYPNHTLILRESAEGLSLRLPGAGLRGSLTPQGDLFATTLTLGERTLDTAVRVADGGRRVVVFFGENGESQLTFHRAGEEQALLLLPLLNDNDREPWALGTPRPIEAKPAEPVTPPGQVQPYRPTGTSGRPTTIFDF